MTKLNDEGKVRKTGYVVALKEVVFFVIDLYPMGEGVEVGCNEALTTSQRTVIASLTACRSSSSTTGAGVTDSLICIPLEEYGSEERTFVLEVI
jgi:hypothetical protein